MQLNSFRHAKDKRQFSLVFFIILAVLAKKFYEMKQLDVDVSPPAFVRNPYFDNSHESMSYTTTPS